MGEIQFKQQTVLKLPLALYGQITEVAGYKWKVLLHFKGVSDMT